MDKLTIVAALYVGIVLAIGVYLRRERKKYTYISKGYRKDLEDAKR